MIIRFKCIVVVLIAMCAGPCFSENAKALQAEVRSIKAKPRVIDDADMVAFDLRFDVHWANQSSEPTKLPTRGGGESDAAVAVETVQYRNSDGKWAN
jgi:hypothetical protein